MRNNTHTLYFQMLTFELKLTSKADMHARLAARGGGAYKIGLGGRGKTE